MFGLFRPFRVPHFVLYALEYLKDHATGQGRNVLRMLVDGQRPSFTQFLVVGVALSLVAHTRASVQRMNF